jgi:hypothetical protein
MNIESLEKVLDSLCEMKASMHDMAETCTIEKLDEAIEIIEQYIESENCSPSAVEEVLNVIGLVLEKLPSIAALLKLLSD